MFLGELLFDFEIGDAKIGREKLSHEITMHGHRERLDAEKIPTHLVRAEFVQILAQPAADARIESRLLHGDLRRQRTVDTVILHVGRQQRAIWSERIEATAVVRIRCHVKLGTASRGESRFDTAKA
jgi:hypothetical protein